MYGLIRVTRSALDQGISDGKYQLDVDDGSTFLARHVRAVLTRCSGLAGKKVRS